MLTTIAILVMSGIVFAALIAFLWRESATGPRRGAKKPAAREASRSRLDDLEMRPRRDRYGPN